MVFRVRNNRGQCQSVRSMAFAGQFGGLRVGARLARRGAEGAWGAEGASVGNPSFSRHSALPHKAFVFKLARHEVALIFTRTPCGEGEVPPCDSSPRPRQLGARSGPIGSFSMRAAVYCPAGNQPDKVSAHGAWLHLTLLAPNAFCGIRAILCSYQGLRLASWLDGGRWGARRHVRWLADSTLVVCFFGICGQP